MNILWGLLWGILLASGFSALLVAGVLLRAILSYVSGAHAPWSLGELPVAALVLAYFIGGISAGVTFGVLWPLARRRTAAWLIGAVAALPFFLAIRFAVADLAGWTGADLVRLAVVSAAWAIGTAALFRVGICRR